MHNDDMISFAHLSVLSVYIWNTKSNIQATLFPASSALPLTLYLCSASCLFNCAPMSINLLRVKQTPPSSVLSPSSSLPVPPGKGVDARPNPLSGGINIASVHPLYGASVLQLLHSVVKIYIEVA